MRVCSKNDIFEIPSFKWISALDVVPEDDNDLVLIHHINSLTQKPCVTLGTYRHESGMWVNQKKEEIKDIRYWMIIEIPDIEDDEDDDDDELSARR